MALDHSGLLRQVELHETQPEKILLQSESSENVEAAVDSLEAMMKMSPVQIQQEYYENLGDCDWVK